MAITEEQAREIQRQWERDSVERDKGQQDAARAAENEILGGENLSYAEYKERRRVLPDLELFPETPMDEKSFQDYKRARNRQRRGDQETFTGHTLAEYREHLKQD